MKDALPVQHPMDMENTSGVTSSSSLTSFPECCSLLCPQLVTEAWRRIRLEFCLELPMLKQRWKLVVFGILMQYVHGMFTQLAHRMHQPQEKPLHDIGFDLTPELGPDKHWVSEALFGTLFALFVVWTFTPFISQRKRFYTVVMWSRLLMVLVVCQALRITTFTVTQLPGPSFHCRAGEAMAVRPWPEHWTGHVVVDVQRQVSKSCGDLIFSSHTTFMLTGILAYTEYGSLRFMKFLAWTCGAIISMLIVASRKHYTVDIVIAWYTVPLVFYTMCRRWTTHRPMIQLLDALGEFDEPDVLDAQVPDPKRAPPMDVAPDAKVASQSHSRAKGALCVDVEAGLSSADELRAVPAKLVMTAGAGLLGLPGTGAGISRARSHQIPSDDLEAASLRGEDRLTASSVSRPAASRIS